ncbi:hypothetical protein GCM10007111_42060 [Virgibacillus kapii]|uniref:Uncharacterized protein n=2 Tax=Virgibacillus TaxID=84406 RepID=A0A024QEG3_9BACI|nr:hypothetical protein GCM10007111_42060 [Virgibacillus kapii]CDQ40580.1 hypothetical protein BN990_02905 [Virgibacillus massiliensis]
MHAVLFGLIGIYMFMCLILFITLIKAAQTKNTPNKKLALRALFTMFSGGVLGYLFTNAIS